MDTAFIGGDYSIWVVLPIHLMGNPKLMFLTSSSPGDGKQTADSRLIQRLRGGDTGAFGEVYDGHCRVVYGLILRMVRNSALAEDLLQETFLKLWRSTAILDERATSLGPWLIAVARNHVLDYRLPEIGAEPKSHEIVATGFARACAICRASRVRLCLY